VQIISANPSDAETLSAIAWAAKAHWGYPPHWMKQWREQLTITPEFIVANETFAATIDGQIVGFHALLETAENLRLEHLWVLPERIGQGIGRNLFTHAVERATLRGARRLTIEADPNAEPFYLHLGAVRIGATTSEIDGHRRELPLLAFDLPCGRRVLTPAAWPHQKPVE
jgi:GNAT superfamily N-acetyltransferase